MQISGAWAWLPLGLGFLLYRAKFGFQPLQAIHQSGKVVDVGLFPAMSGSPLHSLDESRGLQIRHVALHLAGTEI